ncbi:hypothetical protein PSMK_08220 [Phycisphaera mikurensis NBRC 102666]|uniref:Uncharacterized protein n=2 Tax=Phycisphaera TaxID=666508 RepID=I0ICJ3_PHYMF|nr:hypothetical protein PSMK_08220 [Phycisphaera mikurensis NBRC 102666]
MYVNIPSEGGIAASDPNSFNVRDVVADSIAAAVEREPLEGVYEILLPEGTTQGQHGVRPLAFVSPRSMARKRGTAETVSAALKVHSKG